MEHAAPQAWLLLALWLWPLLLMALAMRTQWRWLPALGALPALVSAALLPVGTQLSLPWLLLGTELELDSIGRVFVLFSALLWLIAGIFVATLMYREPIGSPSGSNHFAQRRFNALFLLAMSGQFWALVGVDLVSFYVGFAIMGLAAYGLILAYGDPAARRAGRLYLALTVAGEVALFAGLVSLAAHSGTLTPDPSLLAAAGGPSLALILLGLGVKAAIVPLHLWLPVTYTAAPIPATAVLSSAMIKVAVLGWLRWLPLGAVTWPHWALALSIIGLLSAFYALLIGLIQRDPKAVLAYSSISKMGFLLLLTGLMLGQPDLLGAGITAMLFYATHHALTKAGLFLGLGLYEQNTHQRRTQQLLLAGLIFLALALAAAPLTSGAAAKYLSKPLLQAAPWHWLSPLLWLMTLTTILLMARFLWLLRFPASKAGWEGTAAHPTESSAHFELNLLAPFLAWGLLLALIAALPWLFAPASFWPTNSANLLLALALCALVLILSKRGRNPLATLIGRIAPGDILGPLERSAQRLRTQAGRFQPGQRSTRSTESTRSTDPTSASETALELKLRGWPVAGALWLGLGMLLLLLLLAGAR
ncbi:complex I subunit 5 family protein [Rhabdochromatium marinum]|uniref:complex I subunit 5 family protein n=1 Tax=Rhabdochromatium marinum TaxID=48729 RepID=UPI001908529C|nr:proton-conducting transporter membrane subunit [Rhabdochromatium marinum]MBK1647327.1 hypothetical protein [Rhabdochromatium marinum]